MSPNPWLIDTAFHYIPQVGLGLVMQPRAFQTHGISSPSSSMGARGMLGDSNFSKAIDTEERRKSEHCRFDGDGPNSCITYFLSSFHQLSFAQIFIINMDNCPNREGKVH